MPVHDLACAFVSEQGDRLAFNERLWSMQSRLPSMSPLALPQAKVTPLNLQQQQLRFSPPQDPPSLSRGSLTHRGSTTPRRDSTSSGIPR